jgi:hypothetical protein
MAKHDDILDRPIISLSDNDRALFRDLIIGTLISGSSDSGKTSTAGKQLAHGLLRMPHSGALILVAKREETENWLRYAEQCGRSKDVILFNEKSGHVFDPLAYEWSRPEGVRGAGDIENIIDFFSTLIALGNKEVGHGHDPFGRGVTRT